MRSSWEQNTGGRRKKKKRRRRNAWGDLRDTEVVFHPQLSHDPVTLTDHKLLCISLTDEWSACQQGREALSLSLSLCAQESLWLCVHLHLCVYLGLCVFLNSCRVHGEASPVVECAVGSLIKGCDSGTAGCNWCLLCSRGAAQTHTERVTV